MYSWFLVPLSAAYALVMLVSCFTFSAVPQLRGTRLASERDLLLLVYHPPVAHLPQVSRSTSRTPPQEKSSFSIQQDFVYESQKTYIYIYITSSGNRNSNSSNNSKCNSSFYSCYSNSNSSRSYSFNSNYSCNSTYSFQ